MSNVLVFESDSNFAGELKGELERRGCAVTVVDDASVGLQTAASDKPDLILLTIELPRMNGFSVCNKLKRDPALKEVPLIILSSDSTEETFEQHRRLRTHAEDYVHKPIAFMDLLSRIKTYVPVRDGESAASTESVDEDIVIDEDIDFEEETAQAAPAPAPEPEPASHVDEEVDAFTESAFGAMVDEAPAPVAAAPAPEPVAAAAPESVQALDDVDALDLEAESLPSEAQAPPPPVEAAQPVSKASASIPPRRKLESMDQSLKDELAKQADKIRDLEREIRDSRSLVTDLEDQAKRAASKDSEVQRLQRELDDVKAKAASAAKGGGSAREFLDLREALNKKDKELLDLRDQLTHKEKELLGLKDTNLAAEREKADLGDRIIDLEKQGTDAARQLESAKADKDQAAKRAEDFKRKGEKLQSELDGKTTELVEAKRKQEADLAARDAKEADLIATNQTALEEAEAAKQAAVAAATEHATETTRAEGEAGKDRALKEAADLAQREREQAVSTREGELKKEHDSRLAALHRANEDAMGRLRADHAQVLSDSEKAAAERLAEQEARFAREHEAVVREHETAHEATRGELRDRSAAFDQLTMAKAEAEAERDARIAALSGDLEDRTRELSGMKSTLEGREATLAATEANLAATTQELSEARAELATERAKNERARSKWTDDKSSLERAKDAMAAALAQLDEVEARGLE